MILCVMCGAYNADFAARCEHFYHLKCYRKYETADRGIECSQCWRDISKYYFVERKVYNLKLLACDSPEAKQLYACFDSITVGQKAEYNSDILLQLVKMGFDINSEIYEGPMQFYLACEENDVERMNLLIDFGFDYKKYGAKALSHACEKASLDAFDRLIILGVEIEKDAVFKAIKSNSPEILKRLLEEGAKLNIKDICGRSPVHYAAIFGSGKVLDVLIENGADIHATDYRMNTIFHEAHLYKKDDDFIKRFDGSGFYYDEYNFRHETALIRAIENSNTFVFNFLISQKVDVNLSDNQYETPLHKSCLMGSIEFVKVLIENGANVNAINYEGKTPMHHVCDEKNCDAITRLLLDNGADMHALDIYGRSPYFSLHSKSVLQKQVRIWR